MIAGLALVAFLYVAGVMLVAERVGVPIPAMTPPRYRIAALVVAATWIAAWFAPFTNGTPGWWVGLYGWAGPLGLLVSNGQWSASFEWYANIPFAFCVVWMFLGQRPPRLVAVCAAAIGLTVLVPICPGAMFAASSVVSCPEYPGGAAPYTMAGLATDFWLAALAMNVGVSLFPPSRGSGAAKSAKS